jgi:hypothetical protein
MSFARQVIEDAIAKVEKQKIESKIHQKTKATIQNVMELAAFGISAEQIARTMNVPLEEFNRLYAEEMKSGVDILDNAVKARAYQIIKEADDRTASSMAQFWLKYHTGWKEPAKEMAVTTEDLNYPSRESLLERIIAGEFSKETKE